MALTVADLQGSRTRMRKEAIVRTVLLLAALLSVVVSALIVVALVGRTWRFIGAVDTGSLQ